MNPETNKKKEIKTTKNVHTTIDMELYDEIGAMVKHFGFTSPADLFREAIRDKVRALRKDYREERVFRQQYPKETLLAISNLEERMDGAEEGINFMQEKEEPKKKSRKPPKESPPLVIKGEPLEYNDEEDKDPLDFDDDD